jgi:antitoxin MazE
MLTKVRKWGNSFAVRILKAFTADARLENNTLVEILLVDGQIVVKPLSNAEWTLENLLAAVNPNNLHHETDTGIAIGDEAW